MEQRITMISMGVDDLSRATRFYQALGWRYSRKASSKTITFFQLGAVMMGLYDRQALAKEANLEPGSGFGGIAIAHNTRSEAEVEAVLSLAQQAGAKILKHPEKVFWGGYSGYFQDPEGHVWEVAFNPFLPIAENGAIELPD